MSSTISSQSQGVVAEKNDITPVSLKSFSKLMLELYQKRSSNIKLKRIDRINYGNFSTVVRCSSGLILLREDDTGLAEALPEMRYVSHFILQHDLGEFKANIEYSIF